MNLLINEPPLQVLPSLAVKVGLNGAIFLQQLHFRLLISTNERDEFKWIYRTYEDWKKEFPFWSYDTIKRTVTNLEDKGYIITTSQYNKMKMDKTKWYRIDYSKLGYSSTVHFAPSNSVKYTNQSGQNALSDEGKMHRAIPKDFKNNKNNNIEKVLDVVTEVINYLNNKTNKNFKAKSSATQKLINGRVRDGYTVEDFKRVIDVKVAQWLNNPEMNSYLRPSTLFNTTNFENYLNENTTPKTQTTTTPVVPKPFSLDFDAGEDI